MKMQIQRFRPNITQTHIDSVTEAMSNAELSSGPAILRFENELAILSKKKYCLSTTNGFASIFLAIEALKFKNQSIIVPAISTCLAFVNAVTASGNVPVFVDVNPKSGNIDVEKAQEKFSETRAKMIISPNHSGIKSDIAAMKEFGAYILEDSAQSIGTNFMQPESKADIVCYSFYPTKGLNAVDGGAVLTNDENLANEVRNKRYYAGVTKNDGEIRYNFKMNNLNAVVGLASMQTIAEGIDRKKRICEAYMEVFQKHADVHVMTCHPAEEVYQKFMIKFSEPDQQKRFVAKMNESGVPCMGELFYIGEQHESQRFQKAIDLVNTHCTIPMYEGLKDDEVEYICKVLKTQLNAI